MKSVCLQIASGLVICCVASLLALGQGQPQSSSSSKHPKSSLPHPKSELVPGVVVNGVYQNAALGLSCKVPTGWVLRTEEMNTRDEETADSLKRGQVLL